RREVDRILRFGQGRLVLVLDELDLGIDVLLRVVRHDTRANRPTLRLPALLLGDAPDVGARRCGCQRYYSATPQTSGPDAAVASAFTRRCPRRRCPTRLSPAPSLGDAPDVGGAPGNMRSGIDRDGCAADAAGCG